MFPAFGCATQRLTSAQKGNFQFTLSGRQYRALPRTCIPSPPPPSLQPRTSNVGILHYVVLHSVFVYPTAPPLGAALCSTSVFVSPWKHYKLHDLRWKKLDKSKWITHFLISTCVCCGGRCLSLSTRGGGAGGVGGCCRAREARGVGGGVGRGLGFCVGAFARRLPVLSAQPTLYPPPPSLLNSLHRGNPCVDLPAGGRGRQGLDAQRGLDVLPERVLLHGVLLQLYVPARLTCTPPRVSLTALLLGRAQASTRLCAPRSCVRIDPTVCTTLLVFTLPDW